MKASTAKKTLLDNYFCYLQEYGYLTPPTTIGVLFADMLLNTFDYFSDYITSEFQTDVSNIMMKLDCCNCVIYVDELEKEDDLRLQGMLDDGYMYLPSIDLMDTIGRVPVNMKVDSEGYAHFVD